jgi:rhodanese-related sulfurtransferase
MAGRLVVIASNSSPERSIDRTQRGILVTMTETSGRQTIDQLVARAQARLDRLEPAAALAAQRAGATVIDLRCTDDRREHGTIPGSVPIPLSVVFWRLDPSSGYDDPRLSDPTRQFVLVCNDGYSSSIAAATLRDLGFERATDLAGGFNAWVAAGLPVEAVPD